MYRKEKIKIIPDKPRLVSDEQKSDEDRERLMRLARFAGLFLVLMVIWYSFGLAEVI